MPFLRRSQPRLRRICAALAVLYAGGELAALKAAGFTGQVPVGGKVIQSERLTPAPSSSDSRSDRTAWLISSIRPARRSTSPIAHASSRPRVR
jgi:hypothetical protein